MTHTTTKCIPLSHLTWKAYLWPEKAAKNLIVHKRYSTKLAETQKGPVLNLLDKDDNTLYTFKCNNGFWKNLGGKQDLTDAEVELMRNGNHMFLLVHLAPETTPA